MDAAEYERMYRLEDTFWWYRALHDRVLAAARRCLATSPPGRRPALLDAGCGTGGMAARLAALGEVTALDVSPVALGFAARRPPLAGARLGLGSVEALPVRSRSFDIVVSLDVLCHGAVADEAAAVGEMARALCPGGHLLINLPAYPWLLSAHDRRVLNTRRFHPAQVRALLHGAGLEPARLTCWNTLLFPPAALVRLLRRRHEAAAPEVAAPAPWLNRLLEGTLAAEAAVNRAVPFPFGLSIFAVGRKP